MSSHASLDDYLPTASLETLKRRALVVRDLRAFFDNRGFVEVTTPLLSADTMVDAHIDPISVELREAKWPYFLQTSPEFHMKRLLAAGATAIYQITQAFRGGEVGPLHNVEFTILEWYRVGDDMQAGMQLLGELAQAALGCDAVRQITYADAWENVLGGNPHTIGMERLCELARNFRPECEGDQRDDLLELLWSHHIQPSFTKGEACIVYDFPAGQAALAKIRPGPIPVAERFELFYAGVELANGYHELVDADEFSARIAASNQYRAAAGKLDLPQTSRLELALRHAGLPASTGVALGLDRLVMLAIGEKNLENAMAFPFSRA